MYKITNEKIRIENQERVTYGICYNDTYVIHDVSPDRQQLEKLIKLCNDENLDPIHLRDVVEDFIGQY